MESKINIINKYKTIINSILNLHQLNGFEDVFVNHDYWMLIYRIFHNYKPMIQHEFVNALSLSASGKSSCLKYKIYLINCLSNDTKYIPQ